MPKHEYQTGEHANGSKYRLWSDRAEDRLSTMLSHTIQAERNVIPERCNVKQMRIHVKTMQLDRQVQSKTGTHLAGQGRPPNWPQPGCVLHVRIHAACWLLPEGCSLHVEVILLRISP